MLKRSDIAYKRQRRLSLPSGRLAVVMQERVAPGLFDAPGSLPRVPGETALVFDSDLPEAVLFALSEGPLVVQVGRVTVGRAQAGYAIWLDPDITPDLGTVNERGDGYRYIDVGSFVAVGLSFGRGSMPLLIGDPDALLNSADVGPDAAPFECKGQWKLIDAWSSAYVVYDGEAFIGVYIVAGELVDVFPPRALIERVRWVDGDLVFNLADLRGNDFANQDLRGKGFYGSDIRAVDFSSADLSRCGFSNTVADGAIFRDASLTQAEFSGAWLVQADFTGARLPHANLDEADLSGAILVATVLRGASAAGAVMVGADLRGADLRETNLRGADLFGANLADADLTGAKLAGARMPDGWSDNA
jgi:hypothetical protein